MKKVLIIDTSVLCVWLKVGGKETCGSGVTLLTYEKVNDKIMQEIAEGTQLVLLIVDVASYYSKMGCPVEIFTGDQGLKAYEPQVRLSIPRRRQ